MIAETLFDYATRKDRRERERLQRLAASGVSGVVEKARQRLQAMTVEQLRREMGRA